MTNLRRRSPEVGDADLPFFVSQHATMYMALSCRCSRKAIDSMKIAGSAACLLENLDRHPIGCKILYSLPESLHSGSDLPMGLV